MPSLLLSQSQGLGSDALPEPDWEGQPAALTDIGMAVGLEMA